MKQSFYISVILISAFGLAITACTQAELTDEEKPFIGTWKKDWQKTLDHLKTIPEADSLVLGLSMVVGLEKNDIYTFRDDRTFTFQMSSSLWPDIGSQGTGTWHADKNQNLYLNFKKGTTKGVFGNKKFEPYQIHYKIISKSEAEVTLMAIHEEGQEPGPFLEYLIKQD